MEEIEEKLNNTDEQAEQTEKPEQTQQPKNSDLDKLKSMDLIDAENDLEKAELEYKTAVFNQRRAAIELMKSTQNLDVEKF